MESIFETILKSLYFFLPAFMANMIPVILKFLPPGKSWHRPIMEGAIFLGKPVFGSNKTYMGFFGGVLVAILVVWAQKFLYGFDFFTGISIVMYEDTSFLVLGGLFGFGALFGDLIKSFFKRQVGIESGKPWFPFDQLDFVIGGLTFVSFYFLPDWPYVLCIFLLSLILHPLTNIIAYNLKLKDVWY